MNLGQQLKASRQARQVTQAQIAKDLSVSRKTISSWENERSYPDLAMLIRLSEYFDLSIDQLLKEDGKMKDQIIKQQVRKNIRPLMVLLQFINLICLVFTLADANRAINSSDLVGYIFVAIVILNSIAILYGVAIEMKVNNDQKKQERIETIMKSNWLLVTSIGLVVIGGMTAMLINDDLFSYLGGAIFGVGATLILIHVVLKYKR
ncbi:helix-turn-helix domain-containing protein [Limosilactobacillus gastricus]|uniref:helix-turn-helix domain-containing protein n=1 Tax=Limosilactobacillus gastricus TaxID=227942 RepID=UPI0026EAF0AD|nr:helix-turn-helix transcriptional regulator [Limosilactobacillus gastricus]